MSIRTLSRFGLSLFLVGVISGCSSTGGSVQCRLNPSSCMHEGSYEPGEDEFAEQEAKDLNRAAAKNVRRGSGLRW